MSGILTQVTDPAAITRMQTINFDQLDKEIEEESINDDVYTPIPCTITLMVGTTHRKDVNKKKPFKIIWWPLLPHENSGELVFKFTYQISKDGLKIN